MTDKQHDFTPGRWAIYKLGNIYTGQYDTRLSAMEIQSETAKLICGDRGKRHYGRQINKDGVLFVVSSVDEAQAIIDKSEGISGEMERRITAARDWAKSELKKLIEAPQ